MCTIAVTKEMIQGLTFTRQTATDDWIERFVELINQSHGDNGQDRPPEGKSSSRLRVAILDTGIDINHPEIFGDERVKERKSWTGSPADEDASGHGTHIASTILSLTSNVDVYIAKVTESNVLEDTDRVSDVGGFDALAYHASCFALYQD